MHVVTDTVSTDGNAGRDSPDHREIHVVSWWNVVPALLLVMGMGSASGSDRIDINRADASALEQGLTMVGPSRAAAIVAHRQQHGPFRSVEDLTQVKGIGKVIVERNRQRITTGDKASRLDPAPGAVPVRPVPRR